MSENIENHDLVIIGGGPAGLTASIYASRAMLDAVVIEQGAFGGQVALTDAIDNYPGIEGISGGELGQRMQEHAEHLGAVFAYDEVESLEKNEGGFLVRGSDGAWQAKAVIMAAGATPRHAGFTGEDGFTGRGVSYCATCDGMFYMGKRVFVVGGGNTACEEALFLTRFASQVTLIVRKDHLRAVPSVIEQVKANEKIDVRFLTSILSVEGDAALSKITFRDNGSGETRTETFEEGSFGVFVFVGHDPATSILGDLVDLSKAGAVITDEHMATKTPGLYAAGDIREKPLRQVITAASDGAIAASSVASMLGRVAV